MSEPRPLECRTADEALARGEWEIARMFETALCHRESPEALEGLGLAGWWLDLADVVFDAREHAYRLYRDRGDRRGAARLAVWIAWDTWAFRGEHAVAKTLCVGRFALMPANMNHFAYTTAAETTIVLYGQGPVELKYVNPADDPRNQKKPTP